MDITISGKELNSNDLARKFYEQDPTAWMRPISREAVCALLADSDIDGYEEDSRFANQLVFAVGTSIDHLVRFRFSIGDQVNGGIPETDDYDEGVVTAFVGHNSVQVAWQSGVRTSVLVQTLRAGHPGHWGA